MMSRISIRRLVFSLVLVSLFLFAVTFAVGQQNFTDPGRSAVWHIEALNNGGYVITGQMPEIIVSVPEPEPDILYTFQSVDGHGNPDGLVSVRLDEISVVAATAWPVYDPEGEMVVDIEYGTSIDYGGRNRWSYTLTPYDQVVADLISRGWASGSVPVPYVDPRQSSLPMSVADFRKVPPRTREPSPGP